MILTETCSTASIFMTNKDNLASEGYESEMLYWKTLTFLQMGNKMSTNKDCNRIQL